MGAVWLLTKFAVTAMANLASKDRLSKPSIGTFLPYATTKNLNSYWLSISLSGDTRALHPDPFSSGSISSTNFDGATIRTPRNRTTLARISCNVLMPTWLIFPAQNIPYNFLAPKLLRSSMRNFHSFNTLFLVNAFRRPCEVHKARHRSPTRFGLRLHLPDKVFGWPF